MPPPNKKITIEGKVFHLKNPSNCKCCEGPNHIHAHRESFPKTTTWSSRNGSDSSLSYWWEDFIHQFKYDEPYTKVRVTFETISLSEEGEHGMTEVRRV